MTIRADQLKHLRLLLVLLAVLFGPLLVSAESEKQQTNQELARLKLLAELISKNKDNSPQQAIDYSKEAFELLEQHPDLSLQFQLLFDITRAYDVIDDYQTSLKYSLTALNLAIQHNDMANKAKASVHVGMQYFHFKDFQKAIEYLEQAKTWHAQLSDKKGMVAILLNLSVVLSEADSDKIKPLRLLLEAHQLSKEIDYKKGVAFTANNLGGIYKDLGETDKAMEYALKALKLKRELNHKESIANSLNQIAAIYKLQKEFKFALDYHQQALTLFEQIGDRELRGNTLISMAELFALEGMFDKAFVYYQQGLVFVEELKHYPKLIDAQLSISRTLRQLKRFDEAMVAVKKADEWSLFVTTNESSADIMMERAWILAATDNPAEALDYAIMAEKAFQKDAILPKMQAALDLVSKLHYASGNVELAYQTQLQTQSLAKELAEKQNNEKLALLKINFETEQKEQAIKLLILEKEKQAETIQYQDKQNIFWLLMVTAILAVIFLIVLLIVKKRSEKKRILLESAKQAAEKTAALKARFLADMSHEIRTPLHCISGMTQLLLGTSLNKAQRKRIEDILQVTDDLTKQVNDVLNYSSIEEQGIQVTAIDFNLKSFIEQIKVLMTPLVAAKELEFSVMLDSTLPSIVKGDKEQLRQILVNLLGNAVKFTDTGIIKLSVKSLQDQQVCFEVVDTGMGIPLDQQARILEPFQQATESMRRSHGGTGLGLTITQKLVFAMGGTLSIVSEPGQGACFSIIIELPVGELLMTPEWIPQLDSAANKETLFSQKILLVEDFPLNQKIAMEMLAQDKHKVVIADSVKSAKAFIQKNNFDLILMDVHLPDGDGVSLTKELIAQGVQTPIIGFSASINPDDISRYFDAGMVQVIGKPVKQDILRQSLFAAKNTAQMKPNDLVKSLEYSQQEDWIIDPVQLELLRHSLPKQVLQEIIDDFKGVAKTMQRNIKDAMNNTNEIALKSVLHRYSGAASNLGLIQLVKVLERFEQGEMAELIEFEEILKITIKHLEEAFYKETSI